MKRKMTLVLLSLVCAFCCVAGFAACDDETEKKVTALLIVEAGKQPTAESSFEFANKLISYGETADWSFYKLWLRYGNGETEELALTDGKLTVTYAYQKFNTSEDERKALEKLPDEYIAGDYFINYTYDGNADYRATANLSVNRASSGAFTLALTKSTWGTDEPTLAATLKNPKGKSTELLGDLSANMKSDDTDGNYIMYYMQKSVYDGLTEWAQTDYNYMNRFITDNNDKVWTYVPESVIDSAGEYVLFAIVNQTYNYADVVSRAVAFTVQ